MVAHGLSHAKVTRLDAREEQPTGDLSGFSILL